MFTLGALLIREKKNKAVSVFKLRHYFSFIHYSTGKANNFNKHTVHYQLTKHIKKKYGPVHELTLPPLSL